MRLAVVLPLAVVLACSRGPGSIHVASVNVASDALEDPLREAGLDEKALETAARDGLRGAGFRIGDGARAHRARIDVASVRLAPPIASGGTARVEVSVELELTPTEPGNGAAARETGTAAVELERGDPRSAWLAAVTAAARDAAQGLAIGYTEDAKRVDALVADLEDRNVRVRDAAVRVLAERKESKAVPALVERLRDPEPKIVHRAVGALAQIGDPRAVPPLIDLSRAGDPALAARVARIIGDIGGAEAEGYLLTIASGHPDPRVRRAAREALADMSARAEQARIAARK